MPTWTATGGTIDDAGVYTAGESVGQYFVKAEADGLENIAEVRVRAAAAAGGTGGVAASGQSMLRWEGEVPPQKWMNFYTKVLSRFASTPGLKLTVSFDVPAEGNEGRAKADEARAGLKELGLSSEVEVE